MARVTRRGFVKASTALAAAPALTAIAARAQGPAAPDIGNLRLVDKDVVFAKAGTMDLKLDVYQPPAGVTAKRTAIIHLFGGGFFSGNKSAGYIINDAKALGAQVPDVRCRRSLSLYPECGERRCRRQCARCCDESPPGKSCHASSPLRDLFNDDGANDSALAAGSTTFAPARC